MALSTRYLQSALSGEGRFRLASQTPASVAAGHVLVRLRRERDAAIEGVVTLEAYQRVFWFFRKYKTRESARRALVDRQDEAYLAALALHEDAIETVEHLLDRLETSDLRSNRGEGFCIIPNSEFSLIQKEYESMGFAHEDGTQQVVAAAQELRDKMMKKSPAKKREPPKPPVKPSLISKKKNRNMDL